MAFSPSPVRGWRYLALVALVSITYFLMARLSIIALGIEARASPLWPPAGIALAAVLLGGRQLWVGVALGALGVALSFGVPWWSAVLAVPGNALQVIAGDWLLRRYGFDPSLRRVQEVLKFLLLAILLTPMVNATYGTFHGYWVGTVVAGEVVNNWVLLWLGDGMGILVVTPVLLVWLGSNGGRSYPLGTRTTLKGHHGFLPQRRETRGGLSLPPQPPAWKLEVSLWLGMLLSISWIVFGSTTGSAIANYPLEYLPFPFVVWAALRLGIRGTVLCSLLVSIVAVIGAVLSGGPFITKADGNLEQAILLMQAYISVVGVTALVLAATVAERQESGRLLMQSEASLANAQRIARIGNWDLALAPGTPADVGMQWSEVLYRILGYDKDTTAANRELFLQRVHPQDRTLAENAFRTALDNLTPYSLDYRLLLPDGTERTVNEQVEIHPAGMTGTVQDISDRKQAEAVQRESEKLRTTLYRYMTQDLAEQLLQSGHTNLGGERQFVSILFSDIRDYTTLTETLEPEAVVAFLNTYFESMVDGIFAHKGTLDKFIGDAIMAVFGSPIAQTDHPQRAVETALEMRQRLRHLNHQRQVAQESLIKIGIGINSDYVITGNIGSSKRMEFTAIGDGVNLSARLESATKQYGCDIIISENTYQRCSNLVVRELDYICVKGKHLPVHIYELVGLASDFLSDQQYQVMDLYRQGRKYYLDRDFETAIASFNAVLAISPQDQAASLQIQRCHDLLQHPPREDWDGSWQLTMK